MAAGKSSRIHRQYKTKYRIRNWREYERGLRSRGDVTIWLSEDAIAAWIPPKNGLRGGRRRYSNLATRTALTPRVVFGLPLRQTEGFLDSLLSLMSCDLKALDHTTLSRRNQIADGAYDHRSVYDRASAAGTENVVIVIPPRRSALSAGPTDGPWAQREASLQRIHKGGRREWQKEAGYRQQARVENSFFRYKSVFGGDLKARHGKAQRREAAIRCHILNRMAELGRPSSYALGR